MSPSSAAKLEAMVATASALVGEEVPPVGPDQVHRFEKADTGKGTDRLQSFAVMGVPYAVLLYERFMGRPFATHRDSVSGLVGAGLESAVEALLAGAGISYRRTSAAVSVPGFDQKPDFMVPSELAPQVVIEAKLTEDDGTARDKATRIQHLGSIRDALLAHGRPAFELVACVDGRGFSVRSSDMAKIIEVTNGKVFTLSTLSRMVGCTRLREFRTR